MTKVMVGKVIAGMMIASDKMAILFITSEGEKLIARTDGDCCSHSWVESIELPALWFPFTIQSIEDLELNSELDDQGGELSFYGCKIATDKGDLIIDYRNESNGYYGGSLVWPGDDYFYGGVFGQNASSCEWVELKDAG